LFGEDLAALEPGGGRRGSDDHTAAGSKQVYNACDQRSLRPDDGEICVDRVGYLKESLRCRL
jgi:hypothetical protein